MLVSSQNFGGFAYNSLSGDFGGPSALGSAPFAPAAGVRDSRQDRGKFYDVFFHYTVATTCNIIYRQ
jgi:hypothetical protein